MPKKLEVQKIYEAYEFSEEKIAEICKKFEMKCNFSNRVIFIRTHISNWRIYHDEEKIINILDKCRFYNSFELNFRV